MWGDFIKLDREQVRFLVRQRENEGLSWDDLAFRAFTLYGVRITGEGVRKRAKKLLKDE